MRGFVSVKIGETGEESLLTSSHCGDKSASCFLSASVAIVLGVESEKWRKSRCTDR